MTEAPRVLTLVGGSSRGLPRDGKDDPWRAADGSSLWRVLQPTAELRRQGYCADWDYMGQDGIGAAIARHGYRIIALDRLSWSPEEVAAGIARNYIDTIHRAGAMVVGCYDDDLWLASDEQLTAESDRRLLRVNQDSIHTLRLMDGITVSTQRLATIVRTLTDAPVVVVPNLIDLAWFRAVQAEAVRVTKGLTIGWYGSKRPDSDLEPLGRAWEAIARRYPRVNFVIAGHLTPAVADRVPADRLTVIPYLPLESYPLGLVNIDIGCCSVADTRFNRAKSIIKALEYGARGRTAVVATPTLYKEIVRPNDTGLLAETAEEWEAALAKLIEDGRLRRALARRLGRVVESDWSLQIHAARWLSAWQELIESWRARQPQPRKVELWTPGRVA